MINTFTVRMSSIPNVAEVITSDRQESIFQDTVKQELYEKPCDEEEIIMGEGITGKLKNLTDESKGIIDGNVCRNELLTICEEDKVTSHEIMKKQSDEYPFEIRNVGEPANEDILRDFTGEHTGYLQIGEEKWCLPSNARHSLRDFYNMEVRPTDIWILSFPRSGTTLTQEIVWLLENNLDYEGASKTPLEQRYSFLEFHSLVHPKQIEIFLEENSHSEKNCEAIRNIGAGSFKNLTTMTGRRFIKTHLPLSLLPNNLLTAGCKVVYVARNPKDVAISFFHHNRLIRTRGYIGDFPTYWKYFTRNLVVYSPYWKHILEAWNKRHEKNIIFLFYENLMKDMKNNIFELQEFLGKNYSAEELSTLEKHLQIDNFRKNNSVNWNIMNELGIFKKEEDSFVRKGNTGNTNIYFNEGEQAEANRWIEDNLKGTDLIFPIKNNN